MSFGFNPEQIRQMLKTYDSDGDGKLTFSDFLGIILPSDYNPVLIKKKYESDHGLQVNDVVQNTN